MPPVRIAARAALAAGLLLAAVASDAAPRPSDEQFLGWLQHEVDGPIPWEIAPFIPGPEDVKVGHAVLDALATDPDYRRHLHAWLDDHAAVAESSDALLTAWERHYHEAFSSSFDFQSDVRTQMLWLVEGGTGIARTVPRAYCQSKSQEEVWRLRADSARQALGKLGDTIVKAMSQALVREFQREDGQLKGPPGDAALMAKVAQISLRATVAALPPDDGKRLFDQFSYQAPKVDPQEQCERQWVTSDAILTSRLEDMSKGISSGLLRQSVVAADFSSRLMELDHAAEQLPVQGFTAGKKAFQRPMILVRNGAKGATTVRLHVDEAGRFAGASVLDSSLAPERLTAVDGTPVVASEPLMAALDAYLRAGSFAPRIVQGSGQAYDVDVRFDWR